MTRTQLATTAFLLGAVLIGAGLLRMQSGRADGDAERWRRAEVSRAEEHLAELVTPGAELLHAAEDMLPDSETVVPEDEFWAHLQAAFGEAQLPEEARLEIYRPVEGNVGARLAGAVTRATVYDDDPVHLVDGVDTLIHSILGPEMRMLVEDDDEPRPDLVWFSMDGAGVKLHRLRPVLTEIEHDMEEDLEEHDEDDDREDDEDEDDEHEDDEHEEELDELIEIRPYLLHFVTPMTEPEGITFAYLCEQSGEALSQDTTLVVPSGLTGEGETTHIPLEVEAIEGRRPTSAAGPRLRVAIGPAPAGSWWSMLLVVLGVACVGSVIFLGSQPTPPPPAASSGLTSEAAHEMRTPLTVMRGKLEVALRRDRDAAYYRQTLEECLEEVAALEQLQEAVLLLGRTRRADLVQEDIDVRALARAEAARVQEAHPERDVRLHTNGEVFVVGDPSLLARAIGNLIDNAASHSIDGGAIRVQVRASGSKARILVEDDGPGVPPERHEAIFERFFRGPDVGRRGIPGSGLGLPIVRRIAELHGGTAAIEPGEGGVGRFVITLPRAGG